MNKAIIFLFLISLSLSIKGQSWTLTEQSNISKVGIFDIQPDKYSIYEIDNDQIKEILWNAPSETSVNVYKSKSILTLPLADGTMDEFTFVEYKMMESKFATKYGFKTFRGVSTSNPYRRVRIDYTDYGFRAVIVDTESKTFIDHYQRGDLNHRIVYNKKDFSEKIKWTCDVTSERLKEDDNSQRSMVADCVFREYRLALACTGEYSTFHGGTTALVASAFVTSINRVNQVYEYDNAIRLVLIANTDLLIYLDSGTDPYSNGNGSAMLGQNQTTCDNIIGNANYDIGHVFSTGGGGVAYLNSVCTNSNKAGGVTGQSSPVGDPFDIDYVCHEMGHQFGGNHTQNNSCNRNGATAMEPGSASTIMGYAGICSPNVQTNSDDYFHAISMQEINAWVRNSNHTCETDTLSFNNTVPVIVNQPDYTIPVSTYFALRIDASDADGDPLEYFWDQMDNQVATMPPVSTSTSGPAFRSIKATPSPFRYFPNIDAILTNSTETWEVLPSVSRTMNFRGTVKDYHNVGGCSDEEDVVVTTASSAGPFIVTSQNTAGIIWDAGTQETITWDVANTDVSPVSASNVDIILSFDNGYTYTDTIANSIANNGTALITVPYVAEDSVRIMVKANGNIFFDINNDFIEIQNNTPGYALAMQNNPFIVCSTNASSTTQINAISILSYTGNVDLSVSNNATSTMFSFNPNPSVIGGSSIMTASNYSNLNGDYIMSLTGTDGLINDTFDFTLSVESPLIPTSLINPANNAIDVIKLPLLEWNQNINSYEYNLQISSSSSFSTLELDTLIVNPNCQLLSELMSFTKYYWRVSSINSCGASVFSNVFSFTTKNCELIISTDVPKSISNSGTPTITSTLNVGIMANITDVNVNGLVGDHTYMNDLRFTLISPTNNNIVIWDRPCGNENDFNINLDDEASNSNWPCPPTDGLTYIPDNLLSPFVGSASAGTWTLQIQDLANDDGGSLNAWGLEVCYSDVCTNIVSNTDVSGSGSLDFALNCSSPGDTILFSSSIANDTIDLNFNIFYIPHNLTLLANPNENVYIKSSNSSTLMTFDQSVTSAEVIGLNLLSTAQSGLLIQNRIQDLKLKDVKIYLPSTYSGITFQNRNTAELTINGGVEIIKY